MPRRRPPPKQAAPSAHDTDLPLEQRWLVLKPTLAVAIGKVNAVLAPVRLSIGPAGEPTWSYKNAGYGAHRRMLLGEESLGWLRLELTADGRFHAALKAHKDEHAEINASAETVAASLSPVHASDVLSRCLEPAARYAARAGGGIVDERQLSEQAWELVEPLVLAAIKATNGALAQAGARLVPLQGASVAGRDQASSPDARSRGQRQRCGTHARSSAWRTRWRSPSASPTSASSSSAAANAFRSRA